MSDSYMQPYVCNLPPYTASYYLLHFGVKGGPIVARPDHLWQPWCVGGPGDQLQQDA